MTKCELTPHDTYNIWVDSVPYGHFWFSYGDETVIADASNRYITQWAVPITDDDSGKKLLLTHENVIDAMERLSDLSIDFALNQEERNVIRAALCAADHESATVELVNFDAITNDAIVQVAVLGNVIYG